jgi:hypothetical protein
VVLRGRKILQVHEHQAEQVVDQGGFALECAIARLQRFACLRRLRRLAIEDRLRLVADRAARTSFDGHVEVTHRQLLLA